MARLNLREIEERVAPLANRKKYNRDFLYELLAAYGRSKSSITRLKSGSINVAASSEREVAQKNIVYFREILESTEDALLEVERLRTSEHVLRFNPRFVIVTDYNEMLAWDMKTNESLMIQLRDIAKHFTFFLPWAGMEKTQYVSETHADVKAAEKVGELFDELVRANPGILSDTNKNHGFNLFFTRLLFCFFAEDTGIFTENQFTNAVGSQTLEDGSDLQEFLTNLFLALDTPNSKDKPAYLSQFPYVNGRLFSEDQAITVPLFTRHARKLLINLGSLIWQEINPDIFGSMFQAIVVSEQRSNLGQHYTSVSNILKTVDPLFLDELRQDFDNSYDDVKKLQGLLDRMAEIRIFDPACGTGNFLVIAYKELRKLEHAILERLMDLSSFEHSRIFVDSQINIENFYGIDIDDFAVEVAILSLWIAKHQMNREFKDKFGPDIPLIPLKETGRIVTGNAASIDWNKVCPNDGNTEIYIIGNPPYGGSKKLKPEQRADYPIALSNHKYSKNLDYVSLWFIKGADYIVGTRAELAFVSTNSVSQGEHVALMFPIIFDMGLEISYAYTSFKWENNAKYNAGVSVVVIGLRNISKQKKYIFVDSIQMEVANINGYLIEGPNNVVRKRTAPLSNSLPIMTFGSMPNGKELVLSEAEAKSIQLSDCRGEIHQLIRRFLGADEFIKGNERFCLWIEDDNLTLALSNEKIRKKIERTRETRKLSNRAATIKLADCPHRFGEIRYRPTDSIIVPRVSSERRKYVPIGYLGPDTVVSDSAFAVYDAEPWLFALLTSRMHMVWVRAVGGKLETRYRYSNTIVYNNFPVPRLTISMKERLTAVALRVLDVREYHCERTLAELYDPEMMPLDLLEAHKAVDDLVDSVYSKRSFETDEERLSLLFSLYNEMVAVEDESTSKQMKRKQKGTRQ